MSRLVLRPASALLLLGLIAATGARAETRTLAGTQLVLSDTLSEDVVIGTDATLSGNIRLTMDDGLSCLSIVDTSGSTVVVGTSRCGSDAGPLRIDVSPNTSVTLTSSGSGDLHVADLHSLLIATLTGSGDLVAGNTGGLVLALRSNGDATVGQVDGPATIDISSSGDAKLKQVNGPLTLRQVSSGDLVVGGASTPLVAIEALGSGDIMIGPGHIERLHARVLGSGDLSVSANIDDADVEASRNSDVKLGTVTGRLNRSGGNASNVVAGGTDMADTINETVQRKMAHTANDGTHISIESPSVIMHVLTAAFAVLVLYICWRVIARAGGLSGLRRQFGARTPTVPSNPAVIALGETMTRLEQRLGRLEMYVTTREFDLNRKFREMGS